MHDISYSYWNYITAFRIIIFHQPQIEKNIPKLGILLNLICPKNWAAISKVDHQVLTINPVEWSIQTLQLEEPLTMQWYMDASPCFQPWISVTKILTGPLWSPIFRSSQYHTHLSNNCPIIFRWLFLRSLTFYDIPSYSSYTHDMPIGALHRRVTSVERNPLRFPRRWTLRWDVPDPSSIHVRRKTHGTRPGKHTKSYGKWP